MDVLRSALSLVIHKNGEVLPDDVRNLLEFYKERKGISIDCNRYMEAVAAARERYCRNRLEIFICTDGACLKQIHIHPSQRHVDRLSRQLDCPVRLTGCH